jgi:hypothetical protein
MRVNKKTVHEFVRGSGRSSFQVLAVFRYCGVDRPAKKSAFEYQ